MIGKRTAFKVVATLAAIAMGPGPLLAAFQMKLGQSAERQDFRFIAAIGTVEPDSGELRIFCTGSMISARHVVTAAHCMFDADGRRLAPGELIVAAGQNDLAEIARKDRVAITRAEPHPGYDAERVANDIAVLTLARPIASPAKTGSQRIVPFAGLAPAPGTFVEVAGFGLPDEGKGLVRKVTRDGSALQAGATSLQMARMPLVARDVCQRALDLAAPEAGFPPFKLSDGQVCAGFATQSGDACQGDSGGPMVSRDAAGRATLVGLVSYGIGCGRDGIYGVYTRIAAHADWLRRQMARR